MSLFKFCYSISFISLLLLQQLLCKNEIRVSDEKAIPDIIQLDLNYLSGVFVVKADIGSPNAQRLFLILDTQRNFVSVVTNKCEASKDIVTFDDSKSNSMIIKNSNFTVEMYKEQLVGRLGSDVIILADEEKVSGFDIVLIDKLAYNDVFNWQGYFGLGFSQIKEDNYVYRLHKEGKIKNAMYSLLMRGGYGFPLIHLGGYDKALINETNAEKIKWTNITYTEKDNFTNWYLKSENVYINDNLIDYNHKIILNSASNIVRMPGNFFFNNLKNIFNKKSQCQIWKDNLFHCRCSSDWDTTFPTFTFSMKNNFNITIPPNDYIMLDNTSTQTTDSFSYCVLRLSPNYENDYWILGINFMNDFYTIFDIENSRIGLYHVEDIDIFGLENIIILSFIIVCSSTLFFSFLYCIYKKFTNRRERGEPLLN